VEGASANCAKGPGAGLLDRQGQILGRGSSLWACCDPQCDWMCGPGIRPGFVVSRLCVVPDVTGRMSRGCQRRLWSSGGFGEAIPTA